MAITLSEAASRARKIGEAYGEASYYDALIDGGEWSGPASSRAMARKLDDVAKEAGFADYEMLREAIGDRTSHRWAHFHLP